MTAANIQIRRGTTAEWAARATALAAGEFGYDRTTGEVKLGDGSTLWASLPVAFDVGDGATDSEVAAAITAHSAASDPHGDRSYAAAIVLSHEGDTTNVHGIADTTTLYRSGGTDVAVADGGTGASTAAAARTNLGLGIGVDVASLDAYKQVPAAQMRGITGAEATLRQATYGLRPFNLLTMGDSTGNDTDEFAYVLTTRIATAFPAWTVKYRTWTAPTETWGMDTVLQTGTAGTAYMQCNSGSARAWQVNDNARISVTGDLSLRCKISHAWATGSAAAIGPNKFSGGSAASWRFEQTADGKLFISVLVGGLAKNATSTAAVPFTGTDVGWCGVDVDIDNGAGGWTATFYTSTDGVTLTQLGLPVTTAGVIASIDDTDSKLEIGMRNGSAVFNGRYYAADVYSGLGASGVLVASWRADEAYQRWSLDTSCDDVCGNLWQGTVAAAAQGITGAPAIQMLNGSVSGQALGYFTDSTRLAKIAGSRFTCAILNIGHNHAGLYYEGDSFASAYKAWIDQIRTLRPFCGIVVTAQNPKVTPDTTDNIRTHQDRMRALGMVASIGNCDFLDVFGKFTDSGAAALITSDGIHPNTAGKALWSDMLATHFGV